MAYSTPRIRHQEAEAAVEKTYRRKCKVWKIWEWSGEDEDKNPAPPLVIITIIELEKCRFELREYTENLIILKKILPGDPEKVEFESKWGRYLDAEVYAMGNCED